MSEYTDFLIVGGGIAGICLQLELNKAGHNSILINDDSRNVSSSIAAGIVNPVAGKFFTLTWRAADFFPDLAEYYAGLEVDFGAQFYYPKTIRRILTSAGEQNIWLSKAHMDKYKGYCQFTKDTGQHQKNSFGSIEIWRGGYLNTTVFLKSAKAFLSKNATIRNEHFDHQYLDHKSKTYKGLAYGKIVFCEGYDLVDNPYFNYLPFTPNKGELLEIESEQLTQNEILVGGVFVLPVGGNRFKVGASYEHHVLDLEPTKKNERYLTEKLAKITDMPYKIINQLVGLRPAVQDRRPLLGVHPSNSDMYIFNGLGSKGVSIAPQLAKEMVAYMVSGATINEACSIARF